MPIESRTHSALFKRAEQLKRWEDSETNKVTADILEDKARKIKFSEGCVFLAACAAGDTAEVERLLGIGADINTANVDGLTALHQACIDDNLDMVQFLVEHACDVNRGDNEGWTPLHATASCGFISIAKYLLEHGSNVAAVNNDGDLPLDIAESEDMEELLQDEIDNLGIDCNSARSEEERIMMEDAKQWLNSKKYVDQVHPKTGASALHVAAAKGYIKVLNILIQAGADLNIQDNDGWTPLHAAAHWGQKEACAVLADNLCNMDIQNYVGQTCFDVSDPDLVKLLEELKKKQASLQKDRPEIQAILQRKGKPPLKRRTSVTRMSGQEKSKSVMKDTKSERAQIQAKMRLTEEEAEDEKKIIVEEPNHPRKEETNKIEEFVNAKKKEVIKAKEDGRKEPDLATEEKIKSPEENRKEINENDFDLEVLPSYGRAARRPFDDITSKSDVSVPHLAEQEIAPKKPKKSPNEEIKEIANGPLIESTEEDYSALQSSDFSNSNNESPETKSLSSSNVSTPDDQLMESNPQVRRTFVHPVRDDESEAQRKAHAKRVRETRRSTQGVTLEDLKSAEHQLLKKQQEEDERREREQALSDKKENDVRSTTDIKSWKTNKEEEHKRKENATIPSPIESGATTTTSVTVTTPTRTRQRPVTVSDNNDSVTIPLRVKGTNNDQKKEQEGDNRTALGTQAAIQRRRRHKRRSTGVVYLDGEDYSQEEEPHDKDSSGKHRDKNASNQEITEKPHTRYGSSSSVSSSRGSLNEEPDEDFKKLYDDMKKENERLQEKLEKTEEELEWTKKQLQKSQQNAKNATNDADKKERRALERKLSEMEEEIKEMENLKADNQRLKDENGALIRVISKLSK